MRVNLRRTKSRRLLELRQEGSRKWVRIVLWVMIAALISWYFFGDAQKKGDNQAQSDKSPTMEGDTSGAPLPVFTSLPNGMVSGEAARDLIENLRAQGRGIDLDYVFSRAEEFSNKGMLADAHLMYFFAAKRGHANSAMVLGTMYDPGYSPKPASIIDEPNWSQAHKWYLQAAEGGNQDAQKRLKYLRTQVENATVKGDLEASRLMLQWR
uniref:Sel1 repeat n=1 Tax=Candidatus Kentrum sp. TUN TaxID=2126343 RepID=A0A450ZDI0_9GAMM|nr:MAG: Sel1 repeat [Candidatus Kentron sp. TUN]